jgi:acyl-CoA dehydrogenase
MLPMMTAWRELLSRTFPRNPTQNLEDVLAFLEQSTAIATTTGGGALCAGLASDRVAYAVLGGYEAAMRRLLAPRAVHRASFCVTEEGGGGHPSTMQTRIDERDGQCFVTGLKSFATLASHAEVYVIIGTVGDAHAGRKPLRAALVTRGAPGLKLIPRPPLSFVPEVPHSALELTDVPVTEMLPGDGYDRYVKPFRTVEDAHVTLAVLGYALGEARAHRWSEGDLVRSIEALVTIADERDPTSAETHLSLDAELDRARGALDGLAWESAKADVRERWLRDRPILEVASRARAKRAERARERLGA